jgi:hypothetical protein
VPDVQALEATFAFLAHIMHLVQGDLQSWMGPALGSHISRSYDSQQLWISLIPMLSLMHSVPSSFAFFTGVVEGIKGLFLSQAVLPFMILAYKVAQEQQGGHAGVPAETAPASSSLAAAKVGGKRLQSQGEGSKETGAVVQMSNVSSNANTSSGTDNLATTAVSRTAPSTSPAVPPTSSRRSSSRKASNKVGNGKSRGLQVRLWEALSEDPNFLKLLLRLADPEALAATGKCFGYMLAACAEHVAPPGTTPQCADLSNDPTSGTLAVPQKVEAATAERNESLDTQSSPA